MNAMALSPSSHGSARPAGARPPVAQDFRRAMRQFASSVSLVTQGRGEKRTGVTAISVSVSALSVDPATLLVCISRSSSLCPDLRPLSSIGVSVLAAGQSEFSDRFAERSGFNGADRFNGGDWTTTPAGASVLAAASAVFEGEVEEVLDRYTHAIVIARVTYARCCADGGALVYWRGGYDQVGWSAEEICCAIGCGSGRQAQ